MAIRIFLAGAAGVIGRNLVPLLKDAGYTVFGTTRKEDKASLLKEAGATPVVLDVFDAPSLSRAVMDIRPEIVVHQLTDLPASLAPDQMEAALRRNARIRSEGTRNLVMAAIASGARRLIAQSIAWAYAPGPEPHREGDPLDVKAAGLRGVSVGGVSALEDLTLNSPPLQGIVLRYGHLYGPGTGANAPVDPGPVHVEAAAQAVLLAIDKAERGIFNIAEPNAYVSIEKARRELGWDPSFRLTK
jgi:nucleoside-diphosphate-sugar epimerase